ncbi:MAG: 3-dehydroquinate synthase [Alkalispirochaeta sp.]
MSLHEIAELTLRGTRSRIVRAGSHDLLAGPVGDVNILLCDANTASIPLPGIAGVHRIVVPAGESCKDRDVLFSVLDAFLDAQLTRDSIVAGLGGGAVTDLAAFAASIYLRGISVVLIPTTLLGMVDAAIGGKTGIDHRGYKNVIGTFHPADEIRICPDLLATLPDREYRSGLAEVLKAAFLGDPELLDLLERRADAVLHREPAVLDEMIERAIRVKVGVVQDDFTEQGNRAFLNLGHTFGHALESVIGLGRWTHGEAVAWGIARAMKAGVQTGTTAPEWASRVISLLERYGYDTGPAPVSPDEVVAAMVQDKKRTLQGIRFVLQRDQGETVLVPLERSRILDILKG